MKNIILLHIIFAVSLHEKHLETYVYDEDRFIEKVNCNADNDYLKTKYIIEEQYTWHFTNNEGLQNFLDKDLFSYYGKMNLQTLSGFLVRRLNYIHTGIALRNFNTGMVYIGTDEKEYICLAGRTIYDTKWLRTETLSEFRIDTFDRRNFLVVKGTELDVMDWIEIKPDLVNIFFKAELQDYIIENGKVIFK